METALSPEQGIAAKVVPLKDVRNALMCAIVRQKTTARGRFAAYTQVPFWEPSCRDAARARRLGTPLRRALPQTFSPMERGEMLALLARVRCEHGLREVRKTWAAGMRQLQREFGKAVMQ